LGYFILSKNHHEPSKKPNRRKIAQSGHLGYCSYDHSSATIIKQVAWNKLSLLLKIIFHTNITTKLKQKIFTKEIIEPREEGLGLVRQRV